MTVNRPVARYHGGKFRLAGWIIEHFPTHRIYCEPFAGAASVLMQKPRSFSEIYNDLDGEMVNLFQVLRDPERAARLRTLCELTPYARVEFALSFQPADDSVEQARRTVFRSYAGFGTPAASGYNTGFRCNATRSHTTPCHDWSRWPGQIDTFTARLSRVTIENLPALDCMAKYDTPLTLHYADPPYVSETRVTRTSGGRAAGYRHEMTADDHAELLSRLCALCGMVVVSGNPHPLYDQMLDGWQRVENARYGDGRSRRVECLWLNPAVQRAGVARTLFSGQGVVT